MFRRNPDVIAIIFILLATFFMHISRQAVSHIPRVAAVRMINLRAPRIPTVNCVRNYTRTSAAVIRARRPCTRITNLLRSGSFRVPVFTNR